ncbi:MAG TPA: hypothetical protein VHR97_13175 [Candidatus Baltobacteraceae bacterium]|jgi:hypothetical protein|nr:hypothetical protein [Candidatus Baltobacteraceae bacterium]
MGWLTGIPALVALPLFAIVPAAVAIAAHAWFRHRVPPERLDDHDVAGYLVAVVGVLYSVVLGFLVGTVWTGFSAAQQTADTEAGAVADAFNYAARLPRRERRIIQRLVARYAVVVRDDEWSYARRGVEDPEANRILGEAVTYTTAISPEATRKDSGKLLMEASIQSQLLASLRDVGDARRLRIVQAQSRLPNGMLEALVLGGLMVICFVFFFGMRSFSRQMAITGLVAGSIGLFLGLALELSTPYSGAMHISTDAWTFVIDNNHLRDFAK